MKSIDPGISAIAERAEDLLCWATGAKAAAEAIKEAKTQDFMVILSC
jgi:hypothetical protein